MDKLKKLINTRTAVEGLVLFTAFAVLSFGELAGARPFGYGLYLAVCLAGGSMLAGSILFAVAGAMSGFSLAAVIIAPSLAVFGWLVHFALKKFKAGKKLSIAITIALNLPLYGLLLWLFGATPLVIMLSLCFALVSSAFLSFSLPILAGGRNIRTLNSAGLAALCFAAFVGFAGMSIGFYPLALTMFGLVVLIVGYASGGYAAVASGFLAGLGMAAQSGDISWLAVCAVAAVASAAFCRGYRILSPIALMLGHVMCVFYFSVHYDVIVWDIVALAVAAVIYIAIPKKFMQGVRGYFNPDRALTVLETSSGLGRLLPERVRLISEAFSDMGVYLSQVGATGSEEKEAELLSARLKRYCENCAKSATCPLGVELLTPGSGYRRGRSGISEAVVSVGCIYGGQLLKSANETLSGMESQTSAAAIEKKALNEYGNRLMSLSRMLVSMSKAVAEDHRYDRRLSAMLQSDLHELGITAAEALIGPASSGTLIVHSDVDNTQIDKALTKCLKKKMRTCGQTDFERGWKAVRFERAPSYELVYAFAGQAKSGASGDTYSATISGNRAMLSLCDGRGSGENAAALSNATLSVIEDYYKAGFDAVETVSCVNSLLAASIGEDFSALDVVSIDLTTCAADVIKAGSPPTYIIKKDSVLRIEGSALPVGALDVAKPALSRQMLVEGDIIVLVSDGISDSLPELGELLGGAVTVNVQKLADDILSRAKKTAAKDDMSALVARVMLVK